MRVDETASKIEREEDGRYANGGLLPRGLGMRILGWGLAAWLVAHDAVTVV